LLGEEVLDALPRDETGLPAFAQARDLVFGWLDRLDVERLRESQ
jgi:hypothetical protein